MLSIIGLAIFGLIVGAIARFLLPGRQSMSIWMTMLLGVVGSFVGGIVSYLIFGSGQGALQTSGWIRSIIGAIIALVIYSSLVSKRAV
jgi:uncharacterized membrane protein YeaQ/YmgE (transglycosylase-associated protein family)